MTDLRAAGRPAWQEQLSGHGFRAARRGATARSERAVFALREGWGLLESRRRLRRGDPLAGQHGRPGLWKYVTGSEPATLKRVFEIPPGLLPGGLRGGDAGALGDLVRWALDTERGRCPRSWSPPPLDEVRGWLPEQGLTLETRALARQGRLHHASDRLAISFQVLPPLPPDLPDVRRAWLRELLVDAQNRWRLVRIGVTEASAVEAEVDFTGSPHAALEPLARVGLDALRLVVSWIVEPADLLVDRSVACRALEVGTERARPERGDRS